MLDQRRKPGIDRRPAAPVGIGPPPADQPQVPAQRRLRRLPADTTAAALAAAGTRTAITILSVQSSLGFGFFRRSTATSCAAPAAQHPSRQKNGEQHHPPSQADEG